MDCTYYTKIIINQTSLVRTAHVMCIEYMVCITDVDIVLTYKLISTDLQDIL